MAKAAYNKFILLLCLTGILLAGVALAPSLAWYRPVKVNFGPANIDGAVRASYFESGDGSVFNQEPQAEHAAYEIKYPEQFYNLAWLQYLGCFNEPGENGVIPTTYFYLSRDLDMTGYVLPPIGTRDYPFVGNFDGCGHTVSNLTVSNVLDSEDMAVDEQLKNAEIVGVFGVIGSLAAETNGTESSAALDVEKNYTYSSITNEVKNVTFANVTVETKTANALAGLAAGYVNGTLKNVGVTGGTLDIKENTRALDYTDSLSDYSLVGYCTEPYLDGYDEVTVQHSAPAVNTFTVPDEAENDGDGGSIDVKKLHERVASIWGKAKKADNTDNYKVYPGMNEEVTGEGSICFAKSSNESMFYLYGKVKKNEYWKEGTTTSFESGKTQTYSIYYTDSETKHYLSAGENRVKHATDQKNTVPWTITPQTENGVVTYSIHTVMNGKNCYLVKKNGLLGISQEESSEWKVSGDKIVNTDGSSGNMITYSAGNWVLGIGSSLNFVTCAYVWEDENALRDTYIPLTDVEGGGNTGYIVSGTSYHSEFYPSSSGGDVRILSHSFGNYIASDYGTWKNNFDNNVQILQPDKKDTLNAYKKAKDAFLDNISKDTTKAYSLRFLGGVVDRYVTAENVTIGGQNYQTYEMPEACIDFRFGSAGGSGYVAFFASTHGRLTKSFFSLHQIFRTGSEIDDIREISKIYKKPEGGYEYVYVGEDGRDKSPADLVFDTSILTKRYDNLGGMQASQTNPPKIYYFEIPLNAGEYALGAVSDGAALMYLDIGVDSNSGGSGTGGSGVSITRTRTDEVVTTVTYTVPKGVDFVSAKKEGSSVERATAVKRLDAGASGKYTFTFSAGADTVTCNGSELTVEPLKTEVTERRVTLDYALPSDYDTENGNLKGKYPRQVHMTCVGENCTYEERVGAEETWTETDRATLDNSKYVGSADLPLPGENEIKDLSIKTPALTYSFELPKGSSFEKEWSFTRSGDGGMFTVVLKTKSATSANVSVAQSYTAMFNGTEVTEGNREIEISSILMSLRRVKPLLRLPAETGGKSEDEPVEETAEAVHYAWTDMTDEEFLAWTFERKNWKEIRSVSVMDADSTALRDLYAKAVGLAQTDERQSALDRLDLIYTSWPCFWIDMTDEEFVWWFMNEGINDELLEILQNAESEECITLLQRIADIEDEARRLAAKARLEELRKLLAQHPWEKQTDEDFVYWLSDDTNLVTIRNILADEESEAYASLLARVAAIKDETLRAQAEVRLALIRGLLPKKYDWDTQTDEDFVYWLRDDTNVSAVRAALGDPLAELSLRERIRAITDAALRALAEARLEEIRASDGIYGTDKDTEVVRPGGGVYEGEDDTEIVQPPSPGGTYGVGSDTEVSPPSSESSGLYRNGADTQLISVANAAETGSTPIAVFLPAWSAPAPVQIAALPSVDSIPRSGKGKYDR